MQTTIEHRPDLAGMLAAVRPLRNALECLWTGWHTRASQALGRETPTTASTGMCRLTSRAVRPLLGGLVGGSWRVAGGEGISKPAGFRDRAGEWHAHYWLIDGDGTIVDFTADQFGAEPIVVSAAGDPRYAANYTPAELRSHLSYVGEASTFWTPALAQALGLTLQGRRKHGSETCD